MRQPFLRLYNDDLIIDSFAGGGGASLGIEWALGRSPDIAINHDAEAIALHALNHPKTKHLQGDVWHVNPKEICAGRAVRLLWASPDCKHFSKAKGGKPVEKKIRALAWVVVRFAKAVMPKVIIMENVEEFQDWGPVDDKGRPIKAKKGVTFKRWCAKLRSLGYELEVRQLRAHDFGAPTSRKRLFIIARCDGLAIRWPEPHFGPGRDHPHRTAAECIDWSIPCPSIFEPGRDLVDKTLRRVARGIQRFVLDDPEPFIIPLTHQGDARVYDIREPLRTVTGAHRGEQAVVTPYVTQYNGTSIGQAIDDALRTVTTHDRFAITIPTLIQTSYGERPGQDPRVPGLHKPLGTVVAGGIKHALVAPELVEFAFFAKHYGGHETPGAPIRKPFDTVTCVDHHGLVVGHMLKFYGTSTGQRLDEPAPTVTASGEHFALVATMLRKYLGPDVIPPGDGPVLVTIKGVTYAIVDIGMRMLTPRELYRAQSFPDSYRIDATIPRTDKRGRTQIKPLSKGAQVRMCGNSVCPVIARELVLANFAAGELAATG
jgi:DNA (cytosine-5)-methyltransferase 1